MTSSVKETLCTSCSHSQVCSFKDIFLNTKKAIDEVNVSIEINGMIRLIDIPWIKVDVCCNHYQPNAKLR